VVLASWLLVPAPAVLPAPEAPPRLEAGGGIINVSNGPVEPSVSRTALLNWVEMSRAVSAYYGRFPRSLTWWWS
jgi:hypothetical protein